MPPTIFSTFPEVLIAAVIVGLSQVVYVLFGFGAGLIAVGTLALVLPDVRDVVVLLLLIVIPAELWVVSRSWRRISWRGILRISVGLAVGAPLGTLALRYGEPTWVLTALAIMLLVVGVIFLVLPPLSRPRSVPAVEPVAGLLSGLLSGLFGTGGPPLILYYHVTGVDKAAFRGHLLTLFLFTTLARLPLYGAAGLLTAPRLWSALLMLPVALLGAVIGNGIHRRLPELRFRRAVSATLVVLGTLLLLRHGGVVPG